MHYIYNGQEKTKLKQLIKDNKLAAIGIIIGVVLIVAACLFFWTGFGNESVEWDLTLIGKNGEQQVISYKELCKMPSEKAEGGFFTTVGVVNGPYKVKGVPVTDLCALVGGVTSTDMVLVSAVDGYSMMFDYEQLTGHIETYDPVTMHETPHNELKVLLMFEQDGKPVPYNDGEPLRVAVVGDAALLTEGHYWVKWVNRLEVISLE
jgi:DMSO/TMAO reductase YedYZ molybdopterin-dependent catalytic subunit